MTQQPRTPRRNVIIAGVFAVLALAAFVAAFYVLDGMSLVSDLYSGLGFAKTTTPVQTPTTQAPVALQLPSGMPRDFALRLWQEQIESQETIGRLVDGEIRQLTVSGVTTSGADASIQLSVTFDDGTRIPGRLQMRRIGDSYFVASISALRNGEYTPPTTRVPELTEVDVPLLNTILAEQVESKSNLAEYAEGHVMSVDLSAPVPGPNTVTVPFVMNEDHETSRGNIVLIKQLVDGEDAWFIARFAKTGSVPKK